MKGEEKRLNRIRVFGLIANAILKVYHVWVLQSFKPEFNCSAFLTVKKNNSDSLHGICNNPYGLETLSVGSIISCSTDDLQYFSYDTGFLNRVFEILKSRNIYKYVFLFWIIQQQKLQSSCFFHFVICTWESKSLTNSDMLKCLMYRWTFLKEKRFCVKYDSMQFYKTIVRKQWLVCKEVSLNKLKNKFCFRCNF